MQQINDAGGVFGHGTTYTFRVKRYDDGLSRADRRRQRAARDRRRRGRDRRRGHRRRRVLAARERGRRADRHRPPGRRAASSTRRSGRTCSGSCPTDHGIAFRLRRVPLAASTCGSRCCTTTRGTARRARRRSRTRSRYDPKAITAQHRVPSERDRPLGAGAARPQVAGATALLVWGRPGTIAGRASRAAAERLERAGLRAAGRRRPARPPGAERPSRVARRPHLRGRAADRRGRARRRTTPS